MIVRDKRAAFCGGKAALVLFITRSFSFYKKGGAGNLSKRSPADYEKNLIEM